MYRLVKEEGEEGYLQYRVHPGEGYHPNKSPFVTAFFVTVKDETFINFKKYAKGSTSMIQYRWLTKIMAYMSRFVQ